MFFQEVTRAMVTLELFGLKALIGIAGATVVWIVGISCLVGIGKCAGWIIDHIWDFGMGALAMIGITSQSMTGEITSLLHQKRPLFNKIAVIFWAVLGGWTTLFVLAQIGMTKLSLPFMIAGIVLSVPTCIGLWLVILLLDGGKRPKLAHVPTVVRIAVTWVAPLMAGIPLFRPTL